MMYAVAASSAFAAKEDCEGRRSGSCFNVFRPKGKNYLAYKENPKSQFSTVLYILAKRATLKHEPDLLPTRETLTANALEAARDYVMEGAA